MPPKPSCLCGTCKKCQHREGERLRRLDPEYREKQRQYSATRYRTDPETRRKLRESIQRWRAENPEAYAEQMKRWGETARGKRENHPKRAVREAVHRAIARGDLERQPCEVCGAEPAEAHHDDYSRPLDVSWLCRGHHMERHRRVT